MAEIKVEPKRGGLGWLWAIIILALIAAAAWYFMNNSSAVPATSPADSVRTSMLDRGTAQPTTGATASFYAVSLARA
jgi:hypothetical protein